MHRYTLACIKIVSISLSQNSQVRVGAAVVGAHLLDVSRAVHVAEARAQEVKHHLTAGHGCRRRGGTVDRRARAVVFQGQGLVQAVSLAELAPSLGGLIRTSMCLKGFYILGYKKMIFCFSGTAAFVFRPPLQHFYPRMVPIFLSNRSCFRYRGIMLIVVRLCYRLD